MICSHCHTEHTDGAAFCDECGAPLNAVCGHCQEPNRPGAKFCKKCGQRLAAAASAAPVKPDPPAASATHVPKHLADKILASRRFIEGERKQVTVLFADIRGSTSVAEKLDPEDVRRRFDPILHIMMEAVHRYEGTVNQVLGDGIMALFGAPLAHEDHAVRACYAALAMQDEMRRSIAKLATGGHGALEIGIGINSGEVVVRSITNDLNIDYAALGQTTHLAARMEDLAPAGAIWMTGDTLREVEGFVQVKGLGALPVKGFSNAIEVYELVGITAAKNRLQAAAGRGLSPFVGRKAEIEAFHRFTEPAHGGGRILAMVGEAGMGKSRLVREFLQNHLPSSWRALEAFSVSYGKATPFFPVVQLLRNYFSIAEGDEIATIQAKVLSQMLRLDPALSDAVPPILTLLDAMPQAEKSADADRAIGQHADVGAALAKFTTEEPQERRAETFQALTRLLIRESRERPLLVVFEDLHWIDSETQAFLDILLDTLPLGPLFLLVNYRPGYTHNWVSKDYYTRLRVDPLPLAGARELLVSLLGDHEDLAQMEQLLIKRTEGNPFFVEEMVRSLVEAGVLVGAKGAYRPGVRIESVRLPGSVRTVLADRVDRLPQEGKQLLQTASVIGVVVPMRLLRKVTGLAENELHQYLTELQASEFLYESNWYPDLEYRFTHALTNEVIYGALLRERRTALHAAIVAALEELAGENVFDQLEALAHHAFEAELWHKAGRYLQQAGAKAMSRSAFLEALSDYEQALTALGYMPDSTANLGARIDLHLEARNALFLLGDSARVGEHLQLAENLAGQLGDEQRTARVLNFLNSYYGLAGDPERAIQIGQRALSLDAVQSDRASSTVAYYYLGAAYNKTGQYVNAVDALSRAIDNVDGDLRFERFGTAAVLSVICRSHLVQCLAALGRFDEGAVASDEGIQLGEEANHPTSLIHMICSAGVLHLLKGDFDKAMPILERSLLICSEAKIPVYAPFVASRLGCAYAHAGRVKEAVPYLEQGVEESASAGRVAFLALSTAWLAEGYLFSGRVADAARLAERAVELSRQHKERGHEAWALKLLGDIAVREERRDPARAEANYHAALALGVELGMKPLGAHCQMGLGSLYATVGKRERAEAELAAAVAQFRGMKMHLWQNRAEALLRGLST
jgi:class 3 adenylate cyclase/tetratricopeptide (TPR) repeat protein